MFGLRTSLRISPEVHHLFEFDTEMRISLLEFCEMVDLSTEVLTTWTADQWSAHLQQSSLIKLELDSRHDEWHESATRLLNDLSQ